MAEQAEDVPEAAYDPSSKDIAGWLWKAIYWTVWPIGISLYYVLYYASFAVLVVLRLLYRPLEFILLPVFYLLQFVLNLLLAPFQVLAKFEVSCVNVSQCTSSHRLLDSVHLPGHRSNRRCGLGTSGQLCLRCLAEAVGVRRVAATARQNNQTVSNRETKAQSQSRGTAHDCRLSVSRQSEHVRWVAQSSQ